MLCDAIKVLAFIRYIYLIFFSWMFIRWWQQKREPWKSLILLCINTWGRAALSARNLPFSHLMFIMKAKWSSREHNWQHNHVCSWKLLLLLSIVILCAVKSRGKSFLLLLFLGWKRLFHICTNKIRLLSYTRLASSDFCGHCCRGWVREGKY